MISVLKRDRTATEGPRLTMNQLSSVLTKWRFGDSVFPNRV
jgi:hypothetical protein